MPDVILLEDEPVLRQELGEFLDELGYTPLCVSSLKEFDQHFDASRHHLAVIDIGLPDGCGLDLIQRFAPGRAAGRHRGVQRAPYRPRQDRGTGHGRRPLSGQGLRPGRAGRRAGGPGAAPGPEATASGRRARRLAAGRGPAAPAHSQRAGRAAVAARPDGAALPDEPAGRKHQPPADHRSPGRRLPGIRPAPPWTRRCAACDAASKASAARRCRSRRCATAASASTCRRKSRRSLGACAPRGDSQSIGPGPVATTAPDRL